MSQIPTFDNDFLEDVAYGLRKRRKAISRMFSLVECYKVYETFHGRKEEKLELHIDENTSRRSPGLRLFAWVDRSLWIDARAISDKGKKGWKWTWTAEGRLVGGLSGCNLVSAIEQSSRLLHGMDGSQTGRFDEIWNPLLARGPMTVL
jgi:hypothetical protein